MAGYFSDDNSEGQHINHVATEEALFFPVLLPMTNDPMLNTDYNRWGGNDA